MVTDITITEQFRKRITPAVICFVCRMHEFPLHKHAVYTVLHSIDCHRSVLCQVAPSVRAELEPSSTGDVALTEDKIVSSFNSLRNTRDNLLENREESLKELIGELGVDTQLVLAKGNSISCFFICSSKEQLRQLRDHYGSGLMKQVLEKIFTLLANKDKAVVVRKLQWSSDFNYVKTEQRLDILNAIEDGN